MVVIFLCGRFGCWTCFLGAEMVTLLPQSVRGCVVKVKAQMDGSDGSRSRLA